MLRIGKLKTVYRVVPLALLLVAMTGPWFIDSHPATEVTCAPPLVWQDNGYCACLVSFMATIGMAFKPGQSMLWLLCLPPALPFLSTLLLFLSGERRWLRVCHLAAWGLVAIYSLFLFIAYWYRHPALILWGAGLSGVLAVVILIEEIRVGESPILHQLPATIL